MTFVSQCEFEITITDEQSIYKKYKSRDVRDIQSLQDLLLVTLYNYGIY